MKPWVIAVMALGIILIVGRISAWAAEADIAAAIDAAEQWLTLVDGQAYDESYAQAAGYFQQAVTAEQWQQAITAVRSPLGPVTDRALRNTAYTQTLPGAPDGEYVVLQYNTAFEHKKAAVETITPMLDADGTWRVSGYYIN